MPKTPGGVVHACVAALILALAAMPSMAAAPDVVVTLKPVHGLVAAVMDGVGSPHLLIDGGASPHTYAMKPSDVRRLNQADVIVRVSPNLEAFLAKPLAQVSRKSRIVTLDAETPGLTLYDVRAGGEFEAHTHAHQHEHEHASGHGHINTAGNGDAHPIDTHIWLDPRNAKAIASHVAAVLAESYPAGAERLQANTRALLQRLDALDADLATRLEPVADKRFLVFHDAYQYLERRYGLMGSGSVTVSPEVPPSARRIAEIRGRVKKAGIACIFAEPQFSPRVISAIVEGTQLREATLDPLGAAIEAGPGHYFGLMEGLARDFIGCLGRE